MNFAKMLAQVLIDLLPGNASVDFAKTLFPMLANELSAHSGDLTLVLPSTSFYYLKVQMPYLI